MRERRLAVDQVYRAAYELLNGSVALRPGMNPSADPVVVKVYDEVPEQATQPYLVLGAAFELPDDQHDAYGSVVTFSVQPWSRYRGYAEVVSMLSQAAGALERVGLGHRLHHSPQKLSGGEQQRVAIARALVGEPAVILADEPTGNLDSHSSAAIVELLHDLHAGGGTIVVITHDREIAAQMPRYIAVRDGRIESDSAYAEAGR